VPLFVTSAELLTDVLIDPALLGETIYDPMPIRKSWAPRDTRAGADCRT
jgi:hypothetical protein